MKYDFTRCNNLNFRLNDGTTGFIKVSPSNDVYLYSSDKREWDELRAMPGYKMIARVTNGHSAATYLAEFGLEIIPRDPETYNDWKVGDRVIDKNGMKVYTIIAVLGSAVVMTLDSDISIVALTTTEALTKYYNKLVLTDYEQEILNAKGQGVCPFKKGDRVLVRDKDEDAWIFEIFDSYDGSNKYPYDCEYDCFMRCIPYNEKTWKLLGTTDEYKEEEL